jgi:coproporphyrinogen dehydrogenase HemZ
MIYVKLSGHDFEYEVGELVKLFFFQERIEFLKEEALTADGQAFLIENTVSKTGGDLYSKTVISIGKEVISEEMECISGIDILEEDEKKRFKIGVKKNIYKALTRLKKTETPWGILTGIRPTKIMHSLGERGFSYEDTAKMLSREYMLSDEKIRLIKEIAETEKKYIYPLDKSRYSVYISIPFCPTRCVYCSFPSNSLKGASEIPDEYVDRLIDEIGRSEQIYEGKKIHTVYIGGGTPTTLSPPQMSRIMDEIYARFKREDIAEFTVEAGRPDTITEAKLAVMKEYGVDRISINPQTMNRKTLESIGRSHSPEDIVKSFELARKLGFENINMDIIVGLPGEGEAEIIRTMEEIEKLAPESLTVHTMAIKKSSKLNEEVGKYDLKGQKQLESMLEITRESAIRSGLRPYYMYRQKQILGNFENVGYSLSGKECIYNIMMMEEKETILAFGAGAISKIYYPDEDRFERVPNVKSLEDYLSRVDEMVERKMLFK